MNSLKQGARLTELGSGASPFLAVLPLFAAPTGKYSMEENQRRVPLPVEPR